MKVLLVAHLKFPIAEPFAGGLEVATAQLAEELVRRGHSVSLFARPGSVPDVDVELITPSPELCRRLAHTPPSHEVVDLAEDHAYADLIRRLRRDSGRFDVVHNHALHHGVLEGAAQQPHPVLTTLHTPPLPKMWPAAIHARAASRFVAVSAHTAAAWSGLDAAVVHNGVPADRWPVGPGGASAVWHGRVVPEKGVEHAIRACRAAGMELHVAGPICHEHYFDHQVRPLLGPDVTYRGHLDHRALSRLIGASSVAVMTPRWDEPFGLSAVEAAMCGTPVAAYARGGLGEVLTPETGVLVAPDDVLSLAQGVTAASAMDRGAVASEARRLWSLSRMVDRYEEIYDELVDGHGLVA